ncbi:exported hypothetical protein [Actinacidiphila bryophytorum]|uniref:Uncharacterized protein n=1 Tax=Actinacidiphila bryophytorum TaxID=1436133 RepID=A0A9W4ED44_9ACTN|nr:exported hypothetical protein [Actinacidiphila bryophytorum]
MPRLIVKTVRRKHFATCAHLLRTAPVPPAHRLHTAADPAPTLSPLSTRAERVCREHP